MPTGYTQGMRPPGFSGNGKASRAWKEV